MSAGTSLDSDSDNIGEVSMKETEALGMTLIYKHSLVLSSLASWHELKEAD